MMGVVVAVVVVGVLMRVLVAVDMLVLVMMFMLAMLAMLAMLVMVVMGVLVRVLGGGFVAVEPGHVVIVILELAGKLNVKIAGVDAVLVHARHGNLKAVDRKRGELLAQMLLAGAQVE